MFGAAYTTQLWVYRVLVWVLPLAVLLVVKRVCDELRAKERIEAERHAAEEGRVLEEPA
jgi:hypothetical protein